MFDWKDWKRWLPKRFSRQQAEEQRTRPAAQRAKESPGAGLTRQAAPSPTPMLWNDLLGAEQIVPQHRRGARGGLPGEPGARALLGPLCGRSGALLLGLLPAESFGQPSLPILPIEHGDLL